MTPTSSLSSSSSSSSSSTTAAPLNDDDDDVVGAGFESGDAPLTAADIAAIDAAFAASHADDTFSDAQMADGDARALAFAEAQAERAATREAARRRQDAEMLAAATAKATVPADDNEQPPELRGNLGIVFTCTKCETRAAKVFTKAAYKKGIVLIQCPGCDGLHLIADNQGVFSDEGKKSITIEDIAAEKGISLKRIDDGTLSLSAQELAGIDVGLQLDK
jgi:protein import protein ZIM17